MKFFYLIFAASVFSGCGPGKEVSSTPSLDVEANDMFLPAPTLSEDAPPETTQLQLLVGSWDCTSKDLVDSVWYENEAVWKWEYLLGGHALINHWWQEDTSPNAPTLEYFANGVFIVNPKTHLWEVVVLNSRPHQISPKFQAEKVGDEIHMHDGTGKWLVTFYDMTTNSFEWKYEVKTELGEWSPISEISAKKII